MWQELEPLEESRSADREIAVTDVKVMGLRGNPKGGGSHYTWGIVKVETDIDHYGIGETFRGIMPLDTVERMKETVIGENPLDPERIADKLGRTHYTASGGIGRAAIAAIETACWDIKGKVLDAPVYELLGGKYRSRIPLYSDTEALAGDTTGIDLTEEYTPGAYAEAAEEVVDLGFQALKFDLDVPTPGRPDEDRAARRLDNEGIDHKVALVEAVRDEIGDEIDLGMDFHWSYTVETAVRLGKRLEQFDLAFIEDPVHPEKVSAQQRVRREVDLPVLTGENWTSASQFNEALASDVIDIAAPDVAMCGGLSELGRIAAFCDAHGVPLAPHNLGSPVATVAGAHFGASIRNFYSLEFRGGDAAWWGDLVKRTGEGGPVIDCGHVELPEGPGLGIEITDDAREYVTDEWVFVL